MQTLGDKLGAQIASLQGKMAATDLRSPLSELSVIASLHISGCKALTLVIPEQQAVGARRGYAEICIA